MTATFLGKMLRKSLGKCLDGTDGDATCGNAGASDGSCSNCRNECVQNKGMVSGDIWTSLCTVSAGNIKSIFSFLPRVVSWGYVRRQIICNTGHKELSDLHNANNLPKTPGTRYIFQQISHAQPSAAGHMLKCISVNRIHTPE